MTTLKEIQAMKKPYPYKEVADKLNNYEGLTADIMDSIIGKAEADSLSMVGIKKLYRMCNDSVKELMRGEYEI